MGISTHGYWYPDPATPLTLQGMFSAAATASDNAANTTAIRDGIPKAASAAALTALFTAQIDPATGSALAPVLGSQGSIAGVPVVWNGSAWVLNSPLSGEIKIWPSMTPPAGFLLCDGSSYLRATYANLFLVIGTVFGAVDGTHFTVPDFRGRVPVGILTSDSDFAGPGYAGGNKNVSAAAHTHTEDAHTHGLSAGWADISVASTAAPNFWINYKTVTGWSPSANAGWPSTPSSGGSTQTRGVSLGGTTDAGNGTATGSTTPTATSVVQPYISMNFVIKT